jgi:hypothetical protein
MKSVLSENERLGPIDLSNHLALVDII